MTQHYKNPAKVKEPTNILSPDNYRCKECGESRMNYLEVAVVIDSTDCTVYQIFCNVCSKHTLVEVVSPKVKVALDKLSAEDENVTIHQVARVKSALTGKILDRKRVSAGDDDE